ncbi:hypothetical protein SAMN05421740_101630 [Parapedobacter koreensis]|uniref:Uncharacterized protein n=1 Tax=Parapedobacter koreensis TaxID=332977 RepID=A0A1H7GHB5_9SPHI|nr:hypothetical protein SAMN05421740_101630 [Parapedobacter koreensis]
MQALLSKYNERVSFGKKLYENSRDFYETCNFL